MNANKRMIATAMTALFPAVLAATFGVAAFASHSPERAIPEDTVLRPGQTYDSLFEGKPVNEPTFEWVKDKPVAKGCVSPEAWTKSVDHLPKTDFARIPTESVVVTLDGKFHRVSTDEAWAKAKALNPDTKTGARYWIVASCG